MKPGKWRRRNRRRGLIWGGVPGAILVLFGGFLLVVCGVPVVVALIVYWLSRLG